MTAAQDHPHLLRAIVILPGILPQDLDQLGSQWIANGFQSGQLNEWLTAAAQFLGEWTAGLGIG